MIQDDDNIVLGKSDKVIREHLIADLIYEFMNGGGFSWSPNREPSLADEPELRFDIDKDNSELLATKLNEKIVKRINVLASKLPKPLYLNYRYTVYDIESGSRNIPVRSGFVICIKSPEKFEYECWDGARMYDTDFKVKFKLLCERSDEVHYSSRDKIDLRFMDIRDSESTREVAKLIDHRIYLEKRS